jgi:hypothetical protein
MAAILLAGAAIALSPLGGAASSAKPVDQLKSPECLTPAATGGTAAAAKGGPGLDTRGISQAEQQAIDARTASILKSKRAQGVAPGAGKLAAASIPVYVHVMLSSSGAGDVTASQITQQIAVLNKTYGGQESSQAANTGLTFYLAGTNRYYNLAHRWPEHHLPVPDPPGRQERAEHLASRFRLPRHRHLPVGLREQPENRRHPGAVQLTAGRFGHQLQPR